MEPVLSVSPPESSAEVRRGYQLIAQLATSPIGPLWVARSAAGAERGRVVLLRRLAKPVPLDAATFRRAAIAAFAAREVRDPRLLAVLDVVVGDVELGVVTEYVEGELLRSLQKRCGLGNRPVDLRVALRLGLDVTLAAIAAKQGFLHAADAGDASGSVHGGVLPDSILVASYGESALLDVGVSSAALSRHDLVQRADVIGYRAPEHVLMGVTDERSDVFTIGVLLWELCANRPLFGSPRWTRLSSVPPPPGNDESAGAQQAARARRKVLEMPIPRLEAVVRAGAPVPKDVAAVIAHALERDPGKRTPSLEALCQALEELGAPRFAPTEEVGAWVRSVASTSLEARRVALAAVTGQPSRPPTSRDAASRTTMPPAATIEPVGLRFEELVTSSDALAALARESTHDAAPPPLPRRRTVPVKDE
jgi:serine/threonine protein kinase